MFSFSFLFFGVGVKGVLSLHFKHVDSCTWSVSGSIHNVRIQMLSLQAVFLIQLVEPDTASTSFWSSLKAMSEDPPGAQLVTRHCFLLEDPPNDKDPPALERFPPRSCSRNDITAYCNAFV